LAILLASIGVFGLVVIGIAFAIAGDDILDFAQTTALRIRLNLKEDELNQPIGVDETPIRFRVDDGDTASVIGQNLEASGLITDAKLFADYVQVEELDSQLEAATYFLNKTMNIKEIAAALTDSRFSQITFTIIPGRRIEEIAEAIDADPRFTFTGQDFLNVVGRGAQVDPAFAQTVGLPFGASLEIK
jgi:cell division protein YceG involved in septum cleavage